MAHGTLVRLGSVLLCVAIVVRRSASARPPSAQRRRRSTSTRPSEADDLKTYAARFNEDHPDIEIKWVRTLTGGHHAKLLAEKANPKPT